MALLRRERQKVKRAENAKIRYIRLLKKMYCAVAYIGGEMKDLRYPRL